MTTKKVSALPSATTPYNGTEYSLGIQSGDSVKIPVPNIAGSAGSTLVGHQPTGSISATTVAGAINELDTEKAPIASPTFTGTVSGISKAMVGLGNADNTSDINKPLSTATTTALALKADTSALPTAMSQAVAQAGTSTTAQTISAAVLDSAVEYGAYTPAGTGAISRSVQSKLRDVVSVFDFMTNAQIADVQAGTALVDVTSAIQAAIDYVCYHNVASGVAAGGTIYLPGGIYKTSDTIQLGYGETFKSVHIYGAGKRYGGETPFSGTAIKPTFNDRPVFAVNAGRDTSIKRMSILGLNKAWVQSNYLGNADTAPLIDDLIASNWVNSSFPSSSSSRYAPYCAIAIDPYAAPRPTVSYPDVTFPTWLNRTTQYNNAYSSNTLIEEMDIAGFAVGVVNNPSGSNSNGDFTKLLQCDISYCQYAVSIGNTQSRLVRVSNCVISFVHTGFVTGIHGAQLGKPQILVDSTQVATSTFVFQIGNISYGAGLSFLNCYCESLYAIGFGATGSASNQSPVLFQSCEFEFSTSWGNRGIPNAIYTSKGLSGTAFKSCSFNGNTTVFHFNTQAILLDIDNCTINLTKTPTKLYEKQAINATTGIICLSGTTNLAGYKVNSTTSYNVITGASVGINLQNGQGTGQRCYGLPIYSKTITCSEAYVGDRGFNFNSARHPLDKSVAITLTTTGNTVTVDFTGIYNDWQFIQQGGDVGDVVVDDETQAVFFISARTASTLTLVAQTGLDKLGNIKVAPTKTGNFWTVNCRLYTPYYATIGNTTAGNNTISNFQRPDGYYAYISNAELGVQVDDFLYVQSTIDNLTSQTGGKITTISTNNVTLNSTLNYTETNKRQTLFIRKASANGT